MKKKFEIPLYIVLGVLSLVGGMAFSGFSRDGVEWIPWAKNLLSQSVPEDEKNIASNEVAPMPEEKIAARIKQLEAEIVAETNDPDRTIALRTELQWLRDQLRK